MAQPKTCRDCGGRLEPTTIDPETDLFLDGDPDVNEPAFICTVCELIEAVAA